MSMFYRIVSYSRLKQSDIGCVVHPWYQKEYMRKFRVKRSLNVDELLLVDGLPKRDSVLTPFGEVRKDIPLGLRFHLENAMKVKPQRSMGGYRSKQLEPDRVKSVYEEIPPLSASVVEYEKRYTPTTKRVISVSSPSIEEMLENPELGGIKSVNIDPVSMAVETVVDLIDGAKDFVSNPSLGGVAAMAVTAIPGKIADKIVSRVPGKILGEYDSLNVGPLPDGVAETFSGGKYVHIETNEPIKLYRAYHPGAAKEFGGFWSLDMPKGSLQTQIDSALLPEWGNKASKYTVIEIPSGGKLNVGEVGYQKGLWSGGGTQVLVDGGVKESWKVGEGLLK